MLYLAWESTGDNIFAKAEKSLVPGFRDRLDRSIETETHDLGFLYTLSCVALWRLFGNTTARETAIRAADMLLRRYHEKAGIIQAWGNPDDPAQQGRIIIDCAMNLPLLYWASGETGDPRYREAAARHINTANRYIIRENWSRYHTYFFDTETGEPLRGNTAQGYSDDSCWARGQVWGIYGNALSYQYLEDPLLRENGRGLARYFLNRLPEDLTVYWDMIFTDGDEERDSSAAAIAVCGLLELSAVLTPAAVTFKTLPCASPLHWQHSIPPKEALLVSTVRHREHPAILGLENLTKQRFFQNLIWAHFLRQAAKNRALRDSAVRSGPGSRRG
jgi:unsaturated chondroitin disaccharide hydrolase